MATEQVQKSWSLPVILALVTLITTGILMLGHTLTAEQIEAQKQAKKLASLKRLVPAGLADNDLLADAVTVFEPEQLGHRKSELMYLGKLGGKTTVRVIPVVARNGYSGDIELLVGLLPDGHITAVEIINHKETPGLGDLIERRKSDWLEQFPGTSLDAPAAKQWGVKKDGGAFDQITAATITPRAVVAAIKRALIYQQTLQQGAQDNE